MDDHIIVCPYYPNRVKYMVTTGTNQYIGFIDNITILKRLHFRGEMHGLHVKSAIFKGDYEDGLLLGYAPNASLIH